jgi:hypothetical protein
MKNNFFIPAEEKKFQKSKSKLPLCVPVMRREWYRYSDKNQNKNTTSGLQPSLFAILPSSIGRGKKEGG